MQINAHPLEKKSWKPFHNNYKISPRETVILAENPQKLVDWYISVLKFKETEHYEENYYYSNLETDSGIKIGIAALENFYGIWNSFKNKRF